jgi:hypothetical protein
MHLLVGIGDPIPVKESLCWIDGNAPPALDLPWPVKQLPQSLRWIARVPRFEVDSGVAADILVVFQVTGCDGAAHAPSAPRRAIKAPSKRDGWVIGGGGRDKEFVSKVMRQVDKGSRKIYALND